VNQLWKMVIISLELKVFQGISGLQLFLLIRVSQPEIEISPFCYIYDFSLLTEFISINFLVFFYVLTIIAENIHLDIIVNK